VGIREGTSFLLSFGRETRHDRDRRIFDAVRRFKEPFADA